MTCSMYLKRLERLIGALLLSVSLSGTATAAETEVTPSVELRQEYTDNLFYSPTGQVDTFITRVTPGIKVAAKTELLSGSLGAKISALHYSADSAMDDVEQVYEGNGAFRLSPRLKFSGSAVYRQESWPDRDIEISGQPLNATSRHQNYGAGTEYQISELTVGSLGYGYEDITYSNRDDFSDVTTHNASAGLEHDAGRLLPLLKLRGAAHYSRNDYETALIENYELTIGASRKIHELWSLSADGGGRYTKSGFQVLTLDPLAGIAVRHDASDSGGWVLNTSLDYGGEMLRGSLAYSHDVNNSSGRFGTAVERDAVTLSLNRRLNYELFAVLGGGYFHSAADRNQFGSQKIDETSWRGSFSMRYEFNRNVAVNFGYDYFCLDNSSTGSTASRNKVFFQLTARTTLFE